MAQKREKKPPKTEERAQPGAPRKAPETGAPRKAPETGAPQDAPAPETEAGAGPQNAPQNAPEAEVEPVRPHELAAAPGPKPVGAAGEKTPAPAADRDEEMATLRDQVLRAMAEVDNTRKRLTKERDDAARYGAANLARDMLNVADNLRRALDSIPEGAPADDTPFKALADGVKLIEEELLSIFKRQGVEKIDPYGEKFDHNFHQAMMELENTGKPPGTVAQVIAPGYVLNGRLLRPAMVGVAKGPAGEDGKKKVDTTV